MTDSTVQKRKRIKWEPVALLLIVTLLGVLLVSGPRDRIERHEGMSYINVRLGPVRGLIEMRPESPGVAGPTYVLRFDNGDEGRVLSEEEFRGLVGETKYREILDQHDNLAFRLFNITSWAGLVWILVGFGGQGVFMSRMAVQWIVSERRRESVVPPIFWYLSLGGGLMLMAYFVWRQDIVGVLGQTSGVVIYARNIRLLFKQRRRANRGLGHHSSPNGSPSGEQQPEIVVRPSSEAQHAGAARETVSP